VIHIQHEYDYRMKSEARDQIIDVLKKIFLSIKSNNLPIYGVVSFNIYNDG